MASNKINSKKKGSKNEREVCKFMKEWTGYEFARTPSSGGLRWGKTDNIAGDIVCSDEKHGRRFSFCIEAKFYKDINFEHLILGNKKCKVNEFWKQAKEDGERASKTPLLFMRYNGMPKGVYFIMMNDETHKLLIKSGFYFDVINHTYFRVHSVHETNIIMHSDDLKKTDYSLLHKLNRKQLRNAKK